MIGDIHGRLDLLEALLATIHAELESRPSGDCLLVFLGDLIDRGPASAQVVERLRTYKHSGVQPVFLMGNHEEVLLRVMGGDIELLHQWLSFGGSECLASYGVDKEWLARAADDEAIAVLHATIPLEHVQFIKSFYDAWLFGDYLFVHAGIRPGISFEQQAPVDVRWIRDPFLNHSGDYGFMVVHGHTISDAVEIRANRIGIDTGAYRTGTLTALGLEGVERWILQTGRP